MERAVTVDYTEGLGAQGGAGQLTQIGKEREAFLEEMLSPQKFSKDKGWLDWQYSQQGMMAH